MTSLPFDFRELLAALADYEVEFMVVGGYALAGHGITRATKDLDVWVNPTPDNARKVWAALSRFGAPLADWSLDDFCTPDMVMYMGQPPLQVDFLTSVSGVDWQTAWDSHIVTDYDGLSVPVVGRAALIANKRASGRRQDLLDADKLEGLSQ